MTAGHACCHTIISAHFTLSGVQYCTIPLLIRTTESTDRVPIKWLEKRFKVTAYMDKKTVVRV